MMPLHIYVMKVNLNLLKICGDGSIVFNSGVSDALIICYRIFIRYAILTKTKNLPLPIFINYIQNTKADCTESITTFKFEANDINYNILQNAITAEGLDSIVDVENYTSNIKIDISTIRENKFLQQGAHNNANAQII